MALPDDCRSHEITLLHEDFDFPFDMECDLYDELEKVASIQSDLEKIDVDASFMDYGIGEDMKPEIRNGDCMWPAMANGLNTMSSAIGTGSNSAASSYSETSAISLAVVSGSTNPYSLYQQSQTTDYPIGIQSQQKGSNPGDLPVIIKKEMVDMDYTISQKRRRLSGGDKKSQIQDEDQLIPPGGSLLRKRNPITLPNLMAFRKVGEVKSSKYLRPDTPHSLTDEVVAPEFRHNVDLRACVMGSNNISLTSDDGDVNCINLISRDLQNASKDPIAYRFPIPTINEVLDVLNQQVSQAQIDEQQQAIDIATGCSTVDSPPTTGSDSDSDDGDSINYGLRHHRNSKASSSNNSSSSSNNATNNGMLHMLHISDHSYTRCNDMVDDGPNLETPSDSDEEIDVVSYTDKKLPTNPSCHVMGALQTKMAHKISIDHMKQKPRYNNNFNLPYTPASSSPVKSVANSRYPSPSSTPYQNCSSASPSYSPLSVDSSNVSSSSSSSSQSSFSSISGNKGRKRSCLKAPGGGITSSMLMPGTNGVAHGITTSKKCRGKKVVVSSSSSSLASTSGSISPVSAVGQDVDAMDCNWQRRSAAPSMAPSCTSVLRKEYSLGLDEADTIEKRNQHNDMERQRRIGLKNLFEALKKQIPTIRDKERAPKVNILREAAKLCTQLTQEEHELSVQRQLLSVKLKQQQEILARYRMVKSEAHSVSG